MKTLSILVSSTILGAAVYFAYQNGAGQVIENAYRQWSNTGIESSQENGQKPIPDELKAQAALVIQQQYQKTLSEAPEEDELSDGEKLQKLDEALHDINSEEDEYDRELAVMTLGELKSAEAKQGLITALTDESKLVVSQTIHQINKWPNSADRTEMLLTALQSQNDEIVEETLLSISAVDDKKLIARLKQLTKHANPDIRAAAKLALNLAP